MRLRPLKDAGFTIYQVKTADELVAYYEAASVIMLLQRIAFLRLLAIKPQQI